MSTEYVEPEHLRPLATRELLRLSQTDATCNPAAGLEVAEAAYFRGALSPDPTDITVAGEAAAKAALRAGQLGQPDNEVDKWLQRSSTALYEHASKPGVERELLATYTLGLRIINQRLLRDKGYLSPADSYKAFRFNEDGKYISRKLRRKDAEGQDDRYCTMFYRQAAVRQALGGSAVRGVLDGARGIRAAKNAQDEGQLFEVHKAFVENQVKANFLAMILAASKVIAPLPVVRGRRRKLAHRLVD